ncbi:MAG: ARMT1-like domain-containing protein, partial [Candidatus Omnitrophota bacterium]
MYKDIVQKYIALFMAVTFVIANHVSPCYSFEDHVSYPPCEPQTASTQVSPQHHFDYLPKEQATVTYTSPSQESVSAAPRVVFIDDAHCNYEVQKKIASILKVLHAREKNITVGVEGAFGRIDTTLFSTYPDQTTKEKVFDTYVKEGTISGVELFSLLSHNASPVVGLEEKELYRLEFQAYLDAMTAGTSSMSAIDDLIEKVHRLKSLVYSKDLYRIEKMRDAMRTGAIDTLTYIESLLSWCLTNPIDIHAWPSIQQLLKAKNVHRVDTVRLADELLALEDSIVQKLIGSPRERTLFTLAKELAILKKGIALELERDEYQYLKKNRHSFSVRHAADVLRAIDGTLPDDFYDTFLPHIDIVLNTIITFYDRALEREEVMAQNIIRTANTSAGLCVAVIGGFHREGMIQLLKRQSIYPVVITPKVMNAPQTGIYTTNVLAQSRAMRLNTMALAHWFDEKGTYTEDERLIFFKTIVHKLFPEGLRGPDEEAVYQEWKKQYWKRCRNSDAAMATFELIVRNDDVDTESFIGAINTFPEYAMACLTRMIDKDKKRAEQFMQKVMVKLTEGKRKSAAEETNRFYLCSASPRKKEIFASLVEKMTGVKLNDDFTITGPDSDFEPLSPEGTKESALMALAFYKVFQALQHQSALAPGVYVGSDFIFLDKDDQEIAKPSGAQEARDMYAVLAGQPTKGISGFVVVEVPEKGDPNVHVDTDCSYVILKQPYEIINGRDKKKIIEFMVRTQSENDAEAADTLTKIEKEEYHEITVEELYRCYVNAGLYKGKAGGIGIQDDIFFPLINTIYGDPYVIKGLSFRKLAAILTQNRSLPIAAFSDPQWGIISKNSKLRPCDDLFENDSRMHTYEIELLKRMARDYLMKGKLKTSAQCLFLIAVKSDTATESLRKEFGEIMENEVFNTRNISLKKFIATFRKIEERLNTVWGWRNDRLNSLYTKAVAPLFSDMVSFFESLGNAGNGIIEKIENSDMYFGIKKEKMKTAVDYLIDQDAESLKNYFVEGDLNTIIENILTANEKHFYFKEGFNYSQVRLQDEEDQEHLYKRFLNQIQSKSEHRIAIVVNNVDHELVATLALAHFLIQQGKEVTLFLHPAPNMINDATSYDMFYLQHMFMEKLSSAITKSEDGRKHRLLIDVQNKLVPFFKNNRLRIEQLSPPRGKEHRKELKKLGLHDVAVLIGEDVFGDIEGREGNVFVNMFPTTDLFVIRTKKNATSIENMARQNQLFSGPLKDYALHYEYSFQKKRTRNVQEKADDMHRMPDTTALEKDKFDVLMNEEFIHFMEQTSPEERMWRFMWHKEHGDPQNAFALIAAYLDGGVGSAALQTRREKSLGEWKSECELFLADVLKDEREKRNEAFQEGAALKINFESDSPVARKVVAGLIGTSTLEDYRAGHLLQLASLLKEQEVMRDQDIYRLNKDNPISAAMAVAVAKAWDIAVGQKEGFVMATHTVFCVGDGNIDDKPTIITQQNIDKLFKPKQDVRVYTAIAFVDLNTIKKGMTMPDGSTRYGIPEVKLGYGVAEMKMEDENGTFDADEGEELRARIEREAQERWEILNDFTPEWTGETLFKALQRAHIVYRRALPEGHGFTYEATPPFQKLFEEIFASEVSGEESWKMYFLKTIPQQHADESIGSNEDNRTRIEALIGEIKKRLIKHDDGHFLDEEFSLYNILTNRSYTDKELFNFVRTYILSRSYTHEIPFGLFDLYNPGLFSLVSKVIGDPFTVMGLPYDYFKEYCSSKKFITKKDALAPHEKIANLSFRRMEDMIKFRGPMKQYWEALDEAMRHNTSGSDTLNRMLENIRFNVKKIKLAQRERRLYDAVVYCSEMMDIIQSFASVYEREYKGSLFDEEPYLKEMLNELQKITAKYELGSLSFNPDKWNYDASDLNLVEQTELFRMLDWVTALAFRWPQREAAPRYLDATDKDISQFPHDWAGRYFFYDTCAWEKIERIESSLKRFTSYLASPVDTRSGTLPPKEVFSREEKTGKKAKKLKEEVFKQVYNDLVERIAREHFESDNIEYIRDKPYPLIDHRGGDGLHNEQGEKFFDVLEALIQKNKKDVSIFFNNAGDETILSLWQVCLLLYKGFDVTMYGSAFPTLNTDVTPDDLYFMIPYFDTLLRRQDVSEKYLLSTAFNEGRLAIVPFNAQYSDADDCRNRMIEEMNKYDMNIILGELWYGYLVGLGELSNDPFNAHYDEQYSHDNTAVARLSPVPHLKSGTYVFSIFVHKNARQMLEYRNSLSGAELERQDFIPKHTTAYKGFIFQLFKGGGWQSVHKELVLTYDEKFTLKDIFKEKGFTAFTANVKAACSYYFTLSEDRNLFALEASYNDADDCIQLEYTTPSRRITITIGNEKTTTAGRKRAVMAIDFAVNYEPLHRLNAEYEAIRRSEWPIFRAKIPSLIQDHTVNFLSNIPGNEEKASVEDPSLKYNFATVTLPRLDAVSAQQSGEVYDPSERIDYIRVDIPVDSFTKNKEQFSLLRARSDTVFFAKIEKLFSDGKENTPRTIVSLAPAFIVTTGKDTLFLRILIKNVQKTKNESSVEITDIFASDAACGDIVSFLENEKKIAFTMKNEKRNVTVAIEENSNGRTASTPFGFDIKTKKLTDILPT